ncbi:MAG: 4,5-DOPA dioxygenase extradiol [Candidatus Thorarchaeota archaeon]
MNSNKGMMPTLFIGHGSPMNAIENNKFTKGWEDIAKAIPEPSAILCISAHWYIPDTRIGGMDSPRTIHDFYGFPRELYAQQYPAPGAPKLASEVQHLVHSTRITSDANWGLDHGTWCVLKKMYPKAHLPTTQLSIDYTKSPQQHYRIAQELIELRKQGVLILGSGNLVHNLALARLDRFDSVFDWNVEFDQKMVEYLQTGNHHAIIEYSALGELARKAHPTPDHFLPLVYVLGATSSEEEVHVFNQYYMAGSLSMTSIRIG